MDQNSDQIVEHIERQRDELGRDLDELQTRVKRTTDWRSHYETHPFYFLGAAFGGGLLLSSMTGRSPRHYKYSEPSSSYQGDETDYSYKRSYSTGGSSSLGSSASAYSESPRTQYQKQRAMETLDVVKGALISFAASKAKDLLTDMLPGFDRHMEEAQRRSPDGKGFGSQMDSSSMGSPSATHGAGTPSGASTFGGPSSQGAPQSGGTYSEPSSSSVQSPGSPWSGSGAGTRESV
jgi:hypothetical protein